MTVSPAFLYLMVAAVLLSAIALVVQAIAAYRMSRAVKRMEDHIVPLIPEISATLTNANKTLVESLESIRQLSTKADFVLELSSSQIQKFNETREELTNRMRVQLERIELVLDDSVHRVHEVIHTVHGGVMKPVREASGIIAGVKAGVQALLRGRRPSVDRATHDEEMFI